MAVEDSLDIFGSDPFGRDYLYGLSTGRDGQGLAPYGIRYAENLSQPTTAKGRGYLGDVGGYIGDIGEPRSVMSELSASSEIGGRTVQYPLIVPTLTAQELMLLHSGGKPTPEIYDKAQSWAVSRLAQGQDPFANPVGLRYPQPEGFNPVPRAADRVQESPRGFTSGLFSDVFGGTLNMPSMPRTGVPALDLLYANRNSLFNMAGVGDVQKTAERISYGQPLTTGSGMTLKPREETIFAGMAVAPLVGEAVNLGARAGRAGARMVGERIAENVTMGRPNLPSMLAEPRSSLFAVEPQAMPQGGRDADILEDMTKNTASNTSQFTGFKNTTPYGKAKEVAAYLDKLNVPYTINKSKTTNSAYLEIQTGKGDFDYPMQFRFSDHSTDLPHQNRQIFTNPKPDPNFDLDMFKDGGHDTDFAISKINDLVAKVKPKTVSQPSPYPQQAALDLAQQRAALPVEQGGLGLPANNTAADRAKAMGFDVEAYHGTNASDITKFDLGKSSRGEGTSVALTPENAQAYGNITYPLKVDQQKIFDPTNKDQLKELKSYVENLIQQQKPYDKDSLSFYPFTSKKVLENLANPETGAYYLENEIISKSLKDLGYSGSIGMESGQSQLKIFNPDQIRSRFAAFDPFRKDVATATAMGVALPDLLAQPVNQYQNPYETLPMYTDPFGNTIGSSIR